ncbi:oxidoreductase [candidate division FCPU426 bacterium]|nr:oxidoreductase [candidate division FCPU426 bacterium]
MKRKSSRAAKAAKISKPALRRTKTRKYAPRAKTAAAPKPKVAFYWCSSCGGCEEAVVDLEENILEVTAAVDIVFWPCALDFKTEDVRALPDQSLAVAFINGAVRTSEQEEMVKLLRAKSQLVIAFGACAVQGGIPSLANLKDKESIITRAYREAESVVNPKGTLPQENTTLHGESLTIPRFYETVYTLADVIPVDYYLPGCPPTRSLLEDALHAILGNRLPARGAVLAPNHSLCKTCERNATKPDRLMIQDLKRIHQVAADPESCFLAQGLLCLGPATRDGCGQACIKANMPCTGCFGPLSHFDQGAKMLSALAGIFQAEGETAADHFAASVVDPAGTFYRYGVAASLLGGRRKERSHG